MGNIQSSVVISLTVFSVYVLYVHIYSSHTLLRANTLTSERLPSSIYLNIKYLTQAVTRRRGRLYEGASNRQVVYTVLNSRLEPHLLRRFCSLAGYGWDYPDTDFRDTPLCFPECLCLRLLLMMVLTDENFRLSPAGLVCLHQTVKTLQPVDELKKGPFQLKLGVLDYHQIDAGVEVDVCLSATSRTGCVVWESVLTLLSTNKSNKPRRCLPRRENESQPDEPMQEDVKQVALRVPRTIFLQCGWSSSLTYRLLSLPALLCGYRSPISPSLWMLSACLSEIEKHRGVEVITAPVTVTANFKEHLLVPGRVTVNFWETNQRQSAAQRLSFNMHQQGTNITLMEGSISRP
ncbi:uncharacterized protein si:ch211-12e13.1 [Antennarius striatus]|uniref:uncharacterized protein si:ch211-12e13.1 n=1 Tax=Antennarius striatus TaxID=241820 RepID=UPI0035AEE5F8